ncbi:hypothetical protein FA13DRAFT_283022 [Coprinellus micaceus]|uniref:Uncharacterized protein n=1 Tax=Coprinellus micaceus TaxID=71717 RepID=A0A4Y7TEP9_COPMI|nr:hypothetical protein FA13DRAFT_283022 [Coprinellus micaceus]
MPPHSLSTVLCRGNPSQRSYHRHRRLCSDGGIRQWIHWTGRPRKLMVSFFSNVFALGIGSTNPGATLSVSFSSPSAKILPGAASSNVYCEVSCLRRVFLMFLDDSSGFGVLTVHNVGDERIQSETSFDMFRRGHRILIHASRTEIKWLS